MLPSFTKALTGLSSQTGHFVYEGKGAYTMHKHKGVAKHFSMLAGGTGETMTMICFQTLDKLNPT